MKVLIKILLVCVLIGSFALSRDLAKDSKRESVSKDYANYLILDGELSDNDDLDRKRSHKRRRRIKKPIKGLR